MIIRQVFRQNLIRVNYYVGKSAGRFYSKDSGDSSSSDSDDEAPKGPPKKPAVSNNRLNELLASMKVVDQSLPLKSIEVTPKSLKKRQEAKKSAADRQIEETQTIEKVTRGVAESLGGDAKQTESELLKKLLDISNQASEAKVRAEGGEDSSKLNDIIVGMKIERTKKPPGRSLDGAQIPRRGSTRRSDDRERVTHERVAQIKSLDQEKFDRVNLWSAQSLNLFPKSVQESPDPLKIWSLLQNRDLQATFSSPPRNYFEKMQRWTLEGKIWRFPIDNEQGLDEEARVYFADHVFLEPHLEPWCPKSGPLRHFMELVCVGLSKNPYLTVREKRDHIEWFRDYFEGKKELLQEIIVQESRQGKEAKRE